MAIILDFTNAVGTVSELTSGDGTVYYTLGDTAAVDTGGAAAPLIADAKDTQGVLTGITFFQTQAPATAQSGASGLGEPYSGDASVFNISAANSVGNRYWFVQNTQQRVFGFGNLDPAKTYRLDGLSIRDTTGSRITRWSADGKSATVEAIQNTSETAGLLGLVPDANNEILVTVEYDSGDNAFAYQNALLFGEDATSTPTITDINTNNEVVPGTTATLTGTNLTGATGFNIGSEAQTAFTVVSDTSITFTVVRGGNPYNQNLTGTLLHPDGNATITVQQVPESGTFAVTAASPNTTDDASLWTGLIDTATSDPITIVDGDQAWVKNPNNLTNLAIQPDGTITADETGDFVVQIWLASEGVWGSDQTVSFTVPEEAQVSDLALKKKQNKRRRFTAYAYGAWANRFRRGD